MKKFTKILIALGAAGIAKYIYDHVDIVTNKELEERIKKEADVIAREHTYKLKESKIYKDIGKNIHDGLIEGLNSTQSDNDKKGTGHYPIGSCDHIYYDNPYNISKIYLDKNGCPQVFEFENEKDRNDALEAYYNYLKDCNNKMSIDTTFNIAGLISDNYLDFKNYFVFWHPDDFTKSNTENALPNTINFGGFEHGCKKFNFEIEKGSDAKPEKIIFWYSKDDDISDLNCLFNDYYMKNITNRDLWNSLFSSSFPENESLYKIKNIELKISGVFNYENEMFIEYDEQPLIDMRIGG